MTELFYLQEIGDFEQFESLIQALNTAPDFAHRSYSFLPEADVYQFTFLPLKKSFGLKYDLVYGLEIFSHETWQRQNIEQLEHAMRLLFQAA